MPEQPILTIENLAVSFPASRDAAWRGDVSRVRAVSDVNLSVYPRQTLAVVGESGCGKSVTALSILRLIPTPPGRYEGGRILWQADGAAGPGDSSGGQTANAGATERRSDSGALPGSGAGAFPAASDLLRLSEAQMRSIRGNQIAMIFQEPMTSLNPVYSIGDQILEAILLHQHVSRRQAVEIATQALADVGIAAPASRLKEYPHQMSGGMRQRVMIAMALACQPRLLLADEPTTALDVTIQAQILELLRELQNRRGMSVMLITHDLGVVAENADVVAVMYAGRIVEYGSVHDVFGQPLHPYTQGLFASMPVMSAEGRKRLEAIPGNVPNPASLPGGCAFHPRCAQTRRLAREAPADQTVELSIDGESTRVMGDTAQVVPPLLEVQPQHWVACHHAPGYRAGKPTRPDVCYRRQVDAAV